MNLKQLRYFARVATIKNITHAADTLRVAQTALGFQIKNLEAELGVPLLERHSRGIVLTEAGELFASRIDEILALLEAGVADVRNLNSKVSTSLYFGITPSIMSALGTNRLLVDDDFSSAQQVKFVEALSFNLVAALLREELHFALAFNVPEQPGVIRSALLDEPLFLITPPSEGESGVPVKFNEILRLDLALVSRRDVIWNILHETAAFLSVPMRVAFEVQSTSAIKTLVERGVASSVLPYSLVADEMKKGTLVARPIDNPRAVRTLFLIHRGAPAGFRLDANVWAIISKVLKSYIDMLGDNKRMFFDEDLLDSPSGPAFLSDPRRVP